LSGGFVHFPAELDRVVAAELDCKFGLCWHRLAAVKARTGDGE
jgi:hypothetical protein